MSKIQDANQCFAIIVIDHKKLKSNLEKYYGYDKYVFDQYISIKYIHQDYEICVNKLNVIVNEYNDSEFNSKLNILICDKNVIQIFNRDSGYFYKNNELLYTACIIPYKS